MIEGQVCALLDKGLETEAVALLERAAAGDDTAAQLLLAQLKLQGRGTACDLPGAVALLERGAAGGSVQATMALIALLATGTGCAEDPATARTLLESLRHEVPGAEAQLAMLDLPEPEPEIERLSVSPRIELFRKALSPPETRVIRALAAPQLEPSFIVDPVSGQRQPHPVRNSHGMSFGPLAENLVVNRINRRIARLTDTPYECGEPLHVLRYAPGEEYRPHVDALPGVANQRQCTAITFLNAGFEGGATAFPELGIEVRADEGDLLVFDNVGEDGRGDPRTRHAGLPVTAGEKWIATRWIRCRRYHPWEPETAV